jgi:sugar phosphate isomerase/epimerase
MPLWCAADSKPGKQLFKAIGITAKVARARELRDLGADFIVESVADFLIPFGSDAEFASAKASALGSPLRILGCNSFLRDPSLICIGPKADHPRVLAYAETAFARLRSIGGEYVVFGSSNARQLPVGWEKSRADEQFVSLLRALGDSAKKHNITVNLESLRAQECNYINHLDEAAAVVARADHPSVRVLADLYHMAVMGDGADKLATAMPLVGLIELAERDKRTVPGVAGDDFRPYFQVAARAGYRGLIDIEADGSTDQLRKAFSELRAQAADALKSAKKI